MSLVDRIRSSLFVVGVCYVGAVSLLAFVPWAQTQAIYLHGLKLPFRADFSQPEKYGLAPNKTANVKISVRNKTDATDDDSVALGAWFVLSDAYYHSLSSLPNSPPTPEAIRTALKSYPTILFLHGNAATRAYHVRVRHYSMFSARFKANILAVDYRGFGDSTGWPTEEGLIDDARAALDWIIENGGKMEDVVVWGTSLGTGVAAGLTKKLEEEEAGYLRGCVLMSGFSSIKDLLSTYRILGVVPLLQPFQIIPYVSEIIAGALDHHFKTAEALPLTKKTPLILAHSKNDGDIPYTHSQTLFNALLEDYLPELPKLPPINLYGRNGSEEWEKFSAAMAERTRIRRDLVRKSEVHGVGVVEEFWAGQTVDSPPEEKPKKAPPPPPAPWTPHQVWSDLVDDSNDIDEESDKDAKDGEHIAPSIIGRMVTLVITEHGGHDYVGLQEGVQDIVGRSLGLF